MIYKFENSERVQYNDPYFGTGIGVVVGVFSDNTTNINFYVVFPKNKFDASFWSYMTFVVKENQLISVPF